MDMSLLLTTPLKGLGLLKSSKFQQLYDHLVNIASSRKGQHADLLVALQEMGLSNADAFEYLTCNDKDFVKIVDKFLLKMACTKFYSMWEKVLGPDAETSASKFYREYQLAKELAENVLVEGGAKAASAGAVTTRASTEGASVHSSVANPEFGSVGTKSLSRAHGSSSNVSGPRFHANYS